MFAAKAAAAAAAAEETFAKSAVGSQWILISFASRARPPTRRAGRPTSSLASSGPGNNLMGKMMELLLSKSCGVAAERMVVSLSLSLISLLSSSYFLDTSAQRI